MMSAVASSQSSAAVSLVVLHGMSVDIESDLAVCVAESFADDGDRHMLAQHHRSVKMSKRVKRGMDASLSHEFADSTCDLIRLVVVYRLASETPNHWSVVSAEKRLLLFELLPVLDQHLNRGLRDANESRLPRFGDLDLQTRLSFRHGFGDGDDAGLQIDI